MTFGEKRSEGAFLYASRYPPLSGKPTTAFRFSGVFPEFIFQEENVRMEGSRDGGGNNERVRNPENFELTDLA